MIRGIDGIEIFRDDQDRRAFIDRVSPLVKSTQTRILAWVLMANHYLC
jgi:REP element-mobilizing transposase RayT